MRILVLGGSWFVGRLVVEKAALHGHAVTMFNRGLSSAASPPGVQLVRGDRENDGDLRALAHRGPWDAVIDVAGSVPAVVLRSARILADTADHLVFLSTISVYRDWPHIPVNEKSPLWEGEPNFDPGTRRWDPDAYGPLKAGCEMAWRDTAGADRLLILRPHVVLGRFEYVGRLPWWLARMRRGGGVLVPALDRCIQPIDVEDLAAFLLDQVEHARKGVYNVAAPPGGSTYGDMLRACVDTTARVADRPASLIWANDHWLVRQGVRQWTELPLWRNAAAPWEMNVDRALAAGLRCRPLEKTVEATWAWLCDGGRPVEHERFIEHGIDPGKERLLIDRWLAESSR